VRRLSENKWSILQKQLVNFTSRYVWF
jgi:hypothetical protein